MLNKGLNLIFLILLLFCYISCDDLPYQDPVSVNPDESHSVKGIFTNFTEPITVYLSSMEGDRRSTLTFVDSSNPNQSTFYFDNLVNGRTYIVTPVYNSNSEFEISGFENYMGWEGFAVFTFQGIEINLTLVKQNLGHNNTVDGKMIDFNLSDQNGNYYRMYDRHHKITLVVFAAWWCPWTPYEDLETFYQKYKGYDFQVVLIADDLQKVMDKLSSSKIHVTYPILSGNSNGYTWVQLFQSYNPYGSDYVPLMILVDKNINQIWHGHGVDSSLEMRLLYHL